MNDMEIHYQVACYKLLDAIVNNHFETYSEEEILKRVKNLMETYEVGEYGN
jgi:hypothetical protein